MKQCLSPDTCPAGLQSCLAIVEAFVQKSVPDAESSDHDKVDKGKNTCPKETGKVRCKWNNVVYSTRKWHIGNSQIIFRSEDSELTPGFIKGITGDENPTFTVRPIRPVAGSADFFAKWKDCPIAVCDVAEIDAQVVSCSSVLGHFAAVKALEKYYVILPLFRV